MKWNGTVAGLFAMLLMLSTCAEGRWVHPTNTDVHTQQDWDMCKAEVLSGQEHRKDTMAGGINLSGCMQSKGYSYVEDQPPRTPSSESPDPAERGLIRAGEKLRQIFSIKFPLHGGRIPGIPGGFSFR